MWDSKLSGKKKLAVDEEVIVDYKTSCAIFNYSFKLDGYYFNVVQIQDGKFELKINSFTFTELKEAEEQGLLNKNDNKAEEENLDEYDDDNDNNINNNNNNYNVNTFNRNNCNNSGFSYLGGLSTQVSLRNCNNLDDYRQKYLEGFLTKY